MGTSGTAATLLGDHWSFPYRDIRMQSTFMAQRSIQHVLTSASSVWLANACACLRQPPQAYLGVLSACKRKPDLPILHAFSAAMDSLCSSCSRRGVLAVSTYREFQSERRYDSKATVAA